MREYLLRADAFRPTALAHYRNAQQESEEGSGDDAMRPGIRLDAALLIVSLGLAIVACVAPIGFTNSVRVVAESQSTVELAVSPSMMTMLSGMHGELEADGAKCAGELKVTEEGRARLIPNGPCNVPAGTSATVRVETSVWRLARSCLVRA